MLFCEDCKLVPGPFIILINCQFDVIWQSLITSMNTFVRVKNQTCHDWVLIMVIWSIERIWTMVPVLQAMQNYF